MAATDTKLVEYIHKKCDIKFSPITALGELSFLANEVCNSNYFPLGHLSCHTSGSIPSDEVCNNKGIAQAQRAMTSLSLIYLYTFLRETSDKVQAS